MNIANLQAPLRHFAAEREWQPFHTPKNLMTASMVQAAELAEVSPWMTLEESREAHRDGVSKQRIGEEIADVLLYLLQVADHTKVDVQQAVKDKLVRNAQKYPAKRVVAVVEPVESHRVWPNLSGVSPLRGAGLLRCASSRCQRPTVSPLRAAIPHAGSPPPALAGAQGVAGLRPGALPVRSPMRRSRLRLHRDAEQPSQAGDAGGDDDSGPFPCPGITGLVSFTGT